MSDIYDALEDVQFEHHPTLSVRFGGLLKDGTAWMQLQDSALPEEFNTGRKWRLSQYMTVSEAVQTAWLAYQVWLEHEARESFTYRGVAIFAPHFDVDALVDFAFDRDSYEYRK